MIREGMGNQNWARLVFWLILLSGFFVISLKENFEKDENFLIQFMTPSTRHLNEHMNVEARRLCSLNFEVPREREIRSLHRGPLYFSYNNRFRRGRWPRDGSGPVMERVELHLPNVMEESQILFIKCQQPLTFLHHIRHILFPTQAQALVEASSAQRCWQDSDCLKEAVAVFNLCFPRSKDNWNLFGSKHSHLKQTLLECIQEKGKLNGHNFKNLELFSSMLDTPRRNLASGSSLSPPRSLKESHGRSRSPSRPAKGKEDHEKTIIIAVVVTAVSTFLFAALFFVCWTKVCGNGSGGRINDERPLLSLTSSDYSVGSSINHGGSGKGDKMGNQSFNLYSNQGKMSSFDGSFSDNSDALEERLSVEAMRNNSLSNHGIPPLKPPPGRAVSVLSGNSHSGKVEPLPMEPPKFLKVSSNKPSTPPPPAPPPPMPSSAGPPRPSPPAPPLSSSGPMPPPPPGSSGPKPPPPPGSGGPKPPPPPGSSGPKPPPPPGLKGPRPPPPTSTGPKAPRASGPGKSSDDDPPKTKLKPFFWDKVQANPEQAMVWNDIRSGSFQFNEEMIESLFGYAAVDKTKNDKKGSSGPSSAPQFIQILEPKKGQNLSILLRALNATTEEVCDALREGNELPVEFIQTLLKMAPTPDEELKLRLYCGEIAQLGTAERFLKSIVDIPFAFKRLEALLFMCTLHEEVAFVKESFKTLEVGCQELKGSRLFLKLLEAVLKTGNRMNNGTFRGGAQAFKLDTLLKLADVKGTDGKTTLLHFVVQEIIRSEGIRAARTIRDSQSFSSMKTEDFMIEETSEDTEENYRNLGLEKVSGLSSELEHVKKSANIDADSLTGTVLKMGYSLSKARDFVNAEMMSSGEESGFREALEDFIQNAEGTIMPVLEEEKRIMALVKSTGDYFHGKAGKDEGLRLFVIVRDFLIILDKSCKQVREARGKPVKMTRKQGSTASSASETPRQPQAVDPRQKLFPAITERRMDQSSSDSD